MPRVPQEHLDARRRQILDAAGRAFVRNGFHATSMQDIQREAELSAGAVYRYFVSKEDLIVAIAEENLGRLEQVFVSAVESGDLPPLHELIRRIARTFERLDRKHQLGPLILQVWADAVRSTSIRQLLTSRVLRIRRRLTALVVEYQRQGQLTPGDPEQVAKTLLGFFPGFILQRTLFGDVDADQLAEGLRTLVALAEDERIAERVRAARASRIHNQDDEDPDSLD